MEYEDFKIGTRVRRIHREYNGMVRGNEDIIIGKKKVNDLTLKKYGSGHDYNSFVIIKTNTLKEFLESTI